jgi:hypothetical protein
MLVIVQGESEDEKHNHAFHGYLTTLPGLTAHHTHTESCDTLQLSRA